MSTVISSTWAPIRIFPTERYQTLSSLLDTELGIMFEWCNDNCEKQWTAIWKFQNYYVYFESNSDMTHFYLRWMGMISSSIF